MKKFITILIIFIITLLSACTTKENTIEILKPTEINQKNSGSYDIETLDFNIGELCIDGINYSLKGTVSIPKQSKQRILKLAIVVPDYYKDINRQDKGLKYLTDYIAKNGYLAICIDTTPAYYEKYTRDKEYENIPKIVDEHIKMLKKANDGNNIYGVDLEDNIDFKHIALISNSISKEAIFKLTKEQNDKNVNISYLLLVNPTNYKYNDFNIDNIKNISILVSELDGVVTELDGFNIYDILKDYKKQNIISLTLLKNANHNYFNSNIEINDSQNLDIDLSTQLTREEQENFLKDFTINYLKACFRDKYDNTIYDSKIATVTKINNLDVLTYLQTYKNKNIKDITKIEDIKGKNIQLNIAKKANKIDKDELSEINLPKTNKNILKLLNVKWEYKGAKLSFIPDISDFSQFNNITINTMIYPLSESNVKDKAQSICIELVDNKGRSERVEISKDSNLISYPKGKLENIESINGKEINIWSQITPILNIRIPMVLYNDINLKSIKKFNIIFDRTNSGDLLFESINLD